MSHRAREEKPAFGGPWDVAALCERPEFHMENGDGVRRVYYGNEPYKGKPTRVFAYYAAPRDARERAPGMVLVHGGGGAAFPEWARLWSDRGYAALAMDLAGRGPGGGRMSDGGPDQGDDEKFRDIRRGVQEAWTYHAVAAVIRGASVLAAQPEVDAERMGITGISWGGYLTCIVAGLDDRLKMAAPVYGCGFLHHNSVWLPILATMGEEERALWVAAFDPLGYLPGARMPMLWVNGTNDLAYPLDSFQKSYRLAPGPRTLCVTVRMGHSHTDGWAPKEIGLFADQHLREGVPLASVGPMRVDGGRAEAEFSSPVAVLGAGFHHTADPRAWPEREWRSAAAEIVGDRLRARLPAERPFVGFFTLTDERGATVSTEHAEVR